MKEMKRIRVLSFDAKGAIIDIAEFTPAVCKNGRFDSLTQDIFQSALAKADTIKIEHVEESTKERSSL